MWGTLAAEVMSEAIIRAVTSCAVRHMDFRLCVILEIS